MAKIYYNRGLAGKWLLEDVPARWRGEVAAMLEQADGKGGGE